MAKQTKSGKSFEYALAIATYNKINNGQKVIIRNDDHFKTTKKHFESYSKKEQEQYLKAARSAIMHILKLEPRLENPTKKDDEITIAIQSDQRGMNGDIRDVLIIRSSNNWEIGFSAKNENSAVKHSRLSDKIDFGKKWVGVKCTSQYMQTVGVIFGNVRKLMQESKEKDKILLWRDIPTKITDYYIPLLDAFEKEICILANANPNVPSRLLEYLIGTNDFYKIMKFKDIVIIQGYNLHETLNIPSNSIIPKNKVPKLKFPTKIINVARSGENKTIIIFDNGWQISFRIHNATSRAEPSLKFDVRLEGVPPSLYSHNELW